MHARMRQRQPGLMQAPPTEEQKVQVERARRVAHSTLAAVAALDSVHARQQAAWRQARAQRRHRVDVVRLRFARSDGRAHVIIGRRDDA